MLEEEISKTVILALKNKKQIKQLYLSGDAL
jgi:hypothetical protein